MFQDEGFSSKKRSIRWTVRTWAGRQRMVTVRIPGISLRSSSQSKDPRTGVKKGSRLAVRLQGQAITGHLAPTLAPCRARRTALTRARKAKGHSPSNSPSITPGGGSSW